MKINLETAVDEAQIQIIPMIDVIFCILTFFILAALQLTRQQGINVDLPKAATGAVQMRQMLVVSIDAAGQTFVDQDLIDRPQLETVLRQYRQRNPDGLLVLNASQNALYNDVIQVLDVLRSVGGDKVALATIPAPSVNAPAASGNNPASGNNNNGLLGIPSASPGLFPSPGPTAMPTLPGGNQPLLSPNGVLTPQAPVAPNGLAPSSPQSNGSMPSDIPTDANRTGQ
jgi:biopolymer transport protein ExbD